ncbi:MAG: hypothetical protein AABY64_13260, partial [Bdellovibrionota bacterium]
RNADTNSVPYIEGLKDKKEKTRITDIREVLKRMPGADIDGKKKLIAALYELVKPGDVWIAPIVNYMRSTYNLDVDGDTLAMQIIAKSRSDSSAVSKVRTQKSLPPGANR